MSRVKDDPDRQALERELRGLRTKQGLLGVERLATAPMLTDIVGNGSTDQAFAALMDMLVQHGQDPDGDVRAYFETCGIDSSRDNLNQRLDDYAALHHVDQRTGLRRSDRGATKLSFILRDGNEFFRPGGNIMLHERDGVIDLAVWVEIPADAQWRRPLVYINGARHRRDFELHDHTTMSAFVSAREQFRSIPLDKRADTDDPDSLFTAQIRWAMPVWPIWQVGVTLSDPTLHAVLMTERGMRADIRIMRLDDVSVLPTQLAAAD